MIDYEPHRWLDHFFDVKGSMVLEIIGRVSVCVASSMVVVAIHKSSALPQVAISPLAHTLVGFAIGLLLVFRTNASYDRYWEGRRQWGTITNESRNLGRAVTVLLKDDPALRAEVLAWTAAFPCAVMNRLRREPTTLPTRLGLPEVEAAAVAATSHVPLAVALQITRRLDRARSLGLLTDILFATLDGYVQRLIDALGACERIHSTPLPYVYVVHLRRTLLFYCFTLPFALVDAYGWGAVLVTTMLAYLFFGIEEIGVEIEDPFGADANDLALERYCKRIEADLLGLLPEQEPAAISAGDEDN